MDLYEFGRLIVDGKTYQHGIIILCGKIIDNWWRKEGHKLYINDIEQIIAVLPHTIVIGTGASGMMKVEEELKKELASRRIEVISAETKRLVRHTIHPAGLTRPQQRCI